MKRGNIGLAILLALALPAAVWAAELDVSGNVGLLMTGTDKAGSWDWGLQESLRLRVGGGGPGSTSWQGEFHVSSPGYRLEDNNPVPTPYDFTIDRLFLQWEEGLTRLTLGRQRIAWGVGYAFSPLDQFNPPNPVDPAAPRQGVDGVVVRRSLGDLSYLSLVGVLPRTLDGSISQDPAGGVIWGTNLGTTDVKISYLTDPVKAAHQWGLAAKGDLGLGWSLEGVYQRPWTGGEGAWQGVLGLDYSFLDGKLLLMAEYFYDGTGEPIRYLFSQASYQVDEFVGLSCSILSNLTDESHLLQPTLNWQVDDNARVDLGLMIPVGKEGTEARLTGRDAVLTLKARYSF